MKRFSLLAVCILTLLGGFFTVVFKTHADEITSSGISTVVELADPNTSDGDIISYEDGKGYVRSSKPYDIKIFGVINDNPAVTLEDPDPPRTKAITTTGKAYVKVTTQNGPISPGDVITSSNIPGVGQKALENGHALGTALEHYTEKDPKKVGKILVVLQATYYYSSPYTRENLIRNFTQALDAPIQSPMNAMRYLVAGALIIFCTFLGIIFFGRAAVNGVQAIGRNPLAEKAITHSVIMHLVLTLAVMAVGIAIGYLILVV